MHPFQHTRRLLLAGLAAAAGVGGLTASRVLAQPPAANAPQGQAPTVKVGRAGELIVPLSGLVKFTPKLPAGETRKEVTVGNDQILSVRPDATDPNSVVLVGLNPGITKITVTTDKDRSLEFEVIVQPDLELLKKVITRAVPTASVDVQPGLGFTIILTGYVNKPEDADTILRIAQGAAVTPGGQAAQLNVINAIQVGGVQHVQIEVVVAQVDRTELRERGTDFIVGGNSAGFSSLVAGLITSNGFPSLGNSQVTGNANLRFGLVAPQFFTALRALRTEGLAKFLSEPKVVTQSGRPAFIRSGGQQAVLSATGGGLGSISVTLEQVGTQMEVVPIVYGNGKIYLEVYPQVRTRNDGLGIQTSAGFSPGFTEQSTRAAVMLESGQTFAIGGLLETSVQAIANKVPIAGDLPFVGAAFSNVRYDERERELIILVTPRLVDPLDCTQVPKRVPGRETRSPDDYELFLESLLEAPRGQRQVWNGRCYQAAYKCDPSYGSFPCKGNVCNGGGLTGCATGVLTAQPAPGLPSALPPAYGSLPPAADQTPAPVVTVGSPATPPTEPQTLPPIVPDSLSGTGRQ